MNINEALDKLETTNGMRCTGLQRRAEAEGQVKVAVLDLWRLLIYVYLLLKSAA